MQIIQKVKRKLLFNRDRLSYFHNLSEQTYQRSLQQHLNNLPAISDEDKAIVNQLQQQGIVVTSLDQLNISSTPHLLADATEIIPHLAKVLPNYKNQYLVKASSELLLQYPSLFQWGAELKLLNLVENYLKLPVAYHGVYVRRDLANHVKKKTRLWHLDKEDRKMLKVIIYLSDVSEKIGPFQYISKDLTPWIFHNLRYNYSNITEEAMKAIISCSHWKSCLGKSGTVIIIDPANIFHRGKIPIISDRFSLFFDYTSRLPRYPYYCKSCCDINELIQLSQGLNKTIKNYIFWNWKLKQQYTQKTKVVSMNH
ncbi:MAG: 2OG-Fe(II) oxygenase [Microcoleaceae cyanobacterium]